MSGVSKKRIFNYNFYSNKLAAHDDCFFYWITCVLVNY